MKPLNSITGRDGYIISQALAYAYAVIPHLPELYREESNREDMLEILKARCPTHWQSELDRAAATLIHLGETTP